MQDVFAQFCICSAMTSSAKLAGTACAFIGADVSISHCLACWNGVQPEPCSLVPHLRRGAGKRKAIAVGGHQVGSLPIGAGGDNALVVGGGSAVSLVTQLGDGIHHVCDGHVVGRLGVPALVQQLPDDAGVKAFNR